MVILLALTTTDLITNMEFGWYAVLPKLEEDTSKFRVTEDDVSWFADY